MNQGVFSCGQVTADTWRVTGDTWHAETLIPIVIFSPYKQMKILSYWRAKSDRDLGWFRECYSRGQVIGDTSRETGDTGHVTGDTWHAATKIVTVILNPCNKTKNLSYRKAKSECDLGWIEKCLVVDKWQVTHDGWQVKHDMLQP